MGLQSSETFASARLMGPPRHGATIPMTEGATAVPADDLDSDLVKARFGWMMYDWARSAFETSVVVAVLPAWFSYLFIATNGQELQVGPFEFGPTSMFALVTGVAALIVAVLSPGLGVIADRRPIKQSMLRWMTILGAGATILLGGALLIEVNGRWIWLAVMFLFANIGANAAGVFYNALLPHLGTSNPTWPWCRRRRSRTVTSVVACCSLCISAWWWPLAMPIGPRPSH